MKKKDLEIFLEKVPPFQQPSFELEQYKTPAVIAADMLFQAFINHDIEDKIVIDFGCGTGIFAVGAALLHAQKVYGFDMDEQCIKKAKTFADEQLLTIHYEAKNIKEITQKADTAIMNPPFGAQKKNIHADRVFLEKAIELCSVVYSLHLEQTLPFIYQLTNALHTSVEEMNTYQFPIKGSFYFHKKLVSSVPIKFLRIIKK